MRAVLAVLALFQLAGCAARAPEVRIVESESKELSGVGVGVGAIRPELQFRQGKRVTITYATLFMKQRGGVTKQRYAEGDDVLLAGQRWIVLRIEHGASERPGAVVLQKAP